MPRPSILFEALEIKKLKEEFLQKKQFHFINIVNIRSERGSVIQGPQEMGENEGAKKNESGSEDEEGVVISEDVCIKRSSTIKSKDKIVIE
jgi:hypothetical protein